MLSTAALAATASLIGDPARAGMLAALMDGRALTATELAGIAGIAPQTASGHIAKLSGAGLLSVTRQGRHHYHRLASAEVAQMLESVMSVTARLRDGEARSVVVGPRDAALRRARTCYDHLAGEIAVAINDCMCERGQIELSADGAALTGSGIAFLAELGVALQSPRRGRVFCRPCLDWSERRPHIAGTVGAALCRTFLDRSWIRRMEGTRAVTVTRAGEAALKRTFGLRDIG